MTHCLLCNRDFPDAVALLDHVFLVHGHPPAPHAAVPTPEAEDVCLECGRYADDREVHT